MLKRLDRRGGVLQTFRICRTIIIVVISTSCWVFPVTAEDGHEGPQESVGHHGEGGHHFKNGIALFLGVTDEPGHGNEPTWGVEYAHRVSSRWGVGGLIDYAGGDQRNTVIAPAVFWKPVGGLTLLAAPGVEWHDGRGGEAEHYLKADHAAAGRDQTYFVLRFGAAYYIHLGSRYAIAPAVNLDLVNGHEVWVYGLNLEVSF